MPRHSERSGVLTMRRVLLLATVAGLVLVMGSPLLAGAPGGRGRRPAAAGFVPAGSIADEDVRRAIEKGREWLVNAQTGGVSGPRRVTGTRPISGGQCELATMTLLYTGSHPTNSTVMVNALTNLMGHKLRLHLRRLLPDDGLCLCHEGHADLRAQARPDAPGARRRRPVAGQRPAARTAAGRTRAGTSPSSTTASTSRTRSSPSWPCGRPPRPASRSPTPSGSGPWTCTRTASSGRFLELRGPGGQRQRLRLDDRRRPGHHLHLHRHVEPVERLPVRRGPFRRTQPGRPRTPDRPGPSMAGLALRRHDQSGGPWQHGGLADVLAVRGGARRPGRRVQVLRHAQLVQGRRRYGDRGAGRRRVLVAARPRATAIVTTCFAILFLYKGRAPILFNKLQDTPGGEKWTWNAHRQDIHNLTAYIEKNKEMAIQWQIVSLKGPVEELHDAPVLFISAETAPKFTDEEKKKLREFTDTGGTILLEASCGNPAVRDVVQGVRRRSLAGMGRQAPRARPRLLPGPLSAEDPAARDPGRRRRPAHVRLLRHGRPLVPVADQGAGGPRVPLQVGHRSLYVCHRPQPPAGQTRKPRGGQVREVRLGRQGRRQGHPDPRAPEDRQRLDHQPQLQGPGGHRRGGLQAGRPDRETRRGRHRRLGPRRQGRRLPGRLEGIETGRRPAAGPQGLPLEGRVPVGRGRRRVHRRSTTRSGNWRPTWAGN